MNRKQLFYGHPASCNWNCNIVVRLLDDRFIIPRAGFNPPFAEGAEFTEWKTDALANQATTAGPGCYLISLFSKIYDLFWVIILVHTSKQQRTPNFGFEAWKHQIQIHFNEWRKFSPKKVIQIGWVKLSTQISHVHFFIQKSYPKKSYPKT